MGPGPERSPSTQLWSSECYLLLPQDVREASDPLWETGSVKGVASARVLEWSKFLPVSHLQGSSLKKQKQSMLGNNCKFVFVSLSCVYPQYFLICSLCWAKARWDRGRRKKLKMLIPSHGIALRCTHLLWILLIPKFEGLCS